MKKYHYVYRITNKTEGMHYYGARSCNCLPKEDIGIKYFSSSTSKEFITHQKQNPKVYKYKVIKLFNTRVDAVEYEVYLHQRFNVKCHDKFYNKANQKSKKFDTTGKVVYRDLRDNSTGLISQKEFISNSYLVGASYSVLKGVPKSEETKTLISKALSGRKKSKEHIEARIKTVTVIQENGKSIMQEAASKAYNTKINRPIEHENSIYSIGKKISSTLSEIDSNGLSKAANRAIKRQLAVVRNSENDADYYNKINEKRRKTGNTILENGKTIFQQASENAANTMKTTIQENGKTIEENRHIKARETKYMMADKFNVLHITKGLVYSNLTAMEVYSISASLIKKTKDNWLGKNSSSLRSRLINRGEEYKLDLYVEKVT